jgi:hypothetical protein
MAEGQHLLLHYFLLKRFKSQFLTAINTIPGNSTGGPSQKHNLSTLAGYLSDV